VPFAPTGNIPTSCGSTEFRPRIGEARECGRVSQLSQHSEEITKRLGSVQIKSLALNETNSLIMRYRYCVSSSKKQRLYQTADIIESASRDKDR
jgi:hypothetical protein